MHVIGCSVVASRKQPKAVPYACSLWHERTREDFLSWRE